MKAILHDLKELKTGPKDLRKFGLLVGAVFFLIGLWLRFRGKPAHPWFWTPGAALILLGVVWPRALRQVYLAWMTLAMALGYVVSHIILTVFFFLVITPIGLLARLAGKDFLGLKLDRDATSYWIARAREAERKPAEYENQF